MMCVEEYTPSAPPRRTLSPLNPEPANPKPCIPKPLTFKTFKLEGGRGGAEVMSRLEPVMLGDSRKAKPPAAPGQVQGLGLGFRVLG